jgi:hypothetical protein
LMILALGTKTCLSRYHLSVVQAPTQTFLTPTSGIGVERDIYIWATGSLQFSQLRARVLPSTPGTFNYWADTGVSGIAQVEWDGPDGTANSIDETGLGGVDLTGGDPDTNDGFHLVVLACDHATQITITAYTTASDWSDMTLDLPATSNLNRLDVFFKFTSFTNHGSGVDWEDVGAIVLNVDGTVQSDLDLTIDLGETDSAREYGDLPITYTTSILNANHIPQGLRLGNDCDAELTYNSSTDADGDDTNDFDDEDGVEPTSLPWSAGSGGGAVNVTREGCADLVGGCHANGWIDWNGDGDFNDTVDGAPEHIVNNQSESTDTTETYTFDTPTSYSLGYYYARFRICEGSTDCDNPDTTDTDVTNGEVEDYRWYSGPPTAVTLARLDATNVPFRSSVGAAAVALAFLAGGAAVGGALMRRRQAR